MWGALLRAELIRHSRGGRVHRLRVGWALALYGILAGLYAAGAFALEIPTEELGAFILNQIRDGQLMVGCVIGAAIGAQGTIRDRTEGALDLVALTRMRAPQRWFERTLAQQVSLLGLVATAGPALALCVAMGRVSVAEVVLTMAGALVAVPTMGAVASTLALATERSLWAWLGAMTWGYAVFIAAPQILNFGVRDSLLAVRQPQAWHVIESGPLSPVWAGALGFDQWGGIGMGVLLFGLVVIRGGLRLRRLTGARGRAPWPATLLALGTLAACFAHRWFQPAWGLEAWDEPLALLAGAWLALDVGIGILAIRRRRRARWRLGAWFDQELRSRSHGGVSVVGWWLGGSVGLLLLHAWWSLPPTSTRLTELPWTDASALIGLTLTVLSALLTTAEDRSRGRALAMAPGGPRRLLTYRLLGIAVRTLPFLWFSAALASPWYLPWVVPLWLMVAAGALAAGWGLRSPGAAWGLTLGVAFAGAVGLGQASLWGESGAWMQATFAPMIGEAVPSIRRLAMTGALYGGIGLAFVVLIRVRLRRWLARG